MKKFLCFALAAIMLSGAIVALSPSALAGKNEDITKAATKYCKEHQKGIDRQRCTSSWITKLKNLSDNDIKKNNKTKKCKDKNGEAKYTCVANALGAEQATNFETNDPSSPAQNGQCPPSGCLGTPDSLGIPVLKGGADEQVGSGMKAVITIMGIIAGVISAIFLAIGGINMATSSGNAQKVADARNMLLYAVIGLVISIAAPLIVGFVIGRGPQ